MADPAAPTGGVPCGACGFLNGPGRLYCSDCGAKLDVAPPSYLSAAPVIAPDSALPAAPAAALPAKKPRILTAERRNSFGDYSRMAVRLLLLAALVAFIVLLLRAPEDLPPPADKMDATTVAEIRARLVEVTRRGSTVDAPWPRLNAYLATVLVPADGAASVSGSFVRAVIQPCPGGFTLTTERTAARIPIYTAIDYRIVAIGGSLALQVTGVRIGRIRLPVWAASAAQTFAGDIRGPLQPDLDFIRSAKTVRLSPAGMHLDFGPSRR